MKTLPNLDKKEIWLIKTPKGFNFDKLQQLPISSNFKVDSKQFIIQEDLTGINSNSKASNSDKYSLIVPKSNKKAFKINNGLKINKFFNVKESVEIPNIQYGKVVKKRKDVRVIKGLKPQHFATGYDRTEEDVTSDVDEEEDDEEPNEKVDKDGDVETEDVKTEKKEVKKEKKEKKENKQKKQKKHKKEKK